MYKYVFLAVIFSLVSGQSLCPYEKPQDELMTCLQNMPRIDTGARPDGYAPVGEMRKRQAPVEETEVEKPPEKVDLGAPPILEQAEYVDFLCSVHGAEMVNCSSKVFELCKGYAGLMSVPYNPRAAEETREMCEEYHQEFKDSIGCIETSRTSDAMKNCLESVQSEVPREDIPPQNIRCSSIAGMYNCMVTHIGADCGKMTIKFYISTMRVMEDSFCTKIVNHEYREPVNAGIQLKTTFSLSLLLVAVAFLWS